MQVKMQNKTGLPFAVSGFGAVAPEAVIDVSESKALVLSKLGWVRVEEQTAEVVELPEAITEVVTPDEPVVAESDAETETPRTRRGRPRKEG